MFRKLKQKIEEKDNVDLSIDLSSTHALSSSSVSLSGSENSPLKISSSQESLTIANATANNDTIKKIEESKSKINVEVQRNSDNTKHISPDQKLISKLTIENARLEAVVSDQATQIQRMVAKQDSTEELDGFQNQELSKIKHLLLLSQQSLVKKEDDEKLLREQLSSCESRVQQMQLDVAKSKEELTTCKTLQTEKRNLELEVDRLKQESLKNSTILDEKDLEISHLTERLKDLEKRVESGELDGDEKVQAMQLERKRMEAKLEESYQHAKEIKSTWSEKIHNLETQIFHLNKKMAEDSEDCGRSEKEMSELVKEIEMLRESNWKLEENIEQSKNDMDRIVKDKDKSLRNCKEEEEEWKRKMTELETVMAEQSKEYTKEKQELQSKMAELVKVQTENVEKEIEVEKQISQMENENRRIKTNLSKEEKEYARLSKCLESTSAALEIAEKKLRRLESECSESALNLQECQKNLQKEQTALQSSMSELDSLMMRNAQLSSRVNIVEQELEEERNTREREKEEMETRLSLLSGDCQQQVLKVKELEQGVLEQVAKETTTEEQTSVINKLEEQLADRNKTIKLQQKRLTDMKKTLQRELKVQGGGSNDDLLSSDSNHFNEFGGAISPGKSLENKMSSLLVDEPLSPRRKEDGVVYDQVNFRYLRHVVFKFMTSPEYEAQHLIRAVAVLLHFNRDEEKFIRETLDWKMSWFGSKPQPSREAKRPKAPSLSTVPR